MKFLTALFASAAILFSNPVFPESNWINDNKKEKDYWVKEDNYNSYLQAFSMYTLKNQEFCSNSNKDKFPNMDEVYEKSQFNHLDFRIFDYMIDFSPRNYWISKCEIDAFKKCRCASPESKKSNCSPSKSHCSP